jgi:hypothetical protein
MDREQIYKEIEGRFGVVPPFFKMVSGQSLEAEWRLAQEHHRDLAAMPLPGELAADAHLESCRLL